jgi:hypothetical protein
VIVAVRPQEAAAVLYAVPDKSGDDAGVLSALVLREGLLPTAVVETVRQLLSEDGPVRVCSRSLPSGSVALYEEQALRVLVFDEGLLSQDTVEQLDGLLRAA